ncbi:uncharacterized protein LOC144288826 [Canis aureus]
MCVESLVFLAGAPLLNRQPSRKTRSYRSWGSKIKKKHPGTEGLLLLNSRSPEPGASGRRARVSRTRIWTLPSGGCKSETTCPGAPRRLGAAKSRSESSLGPATVDGRPCGWDQGLSGVEIHL